MPIGYIKDYTWVLFSTKLSWYWLAKSGNLCLHQWAAVHAKNSIVLSGHLKKATAPFPELVLRFFSYPTLLFYTKCHILLSFYGILGYSFFFFFLFSLGFMNIVLLGLNREWNVSTSNIWALKNANINILYQNQDYFFYLSHTRCLVYMNTSIIKILKPALPGRRGCSVGLYLRSSKQMTLLM